VELVKASDIPNLIADQNYVSMLHASGAVIIEWWVVAPHRCLSILLGHETIFAQIGGRLKGSVEAVGIGQR
jgi:hypothetical protein